MNQPMVFVFKHFFIRRQERQPRRRSSLHSTPHNAEAERTVTFISPYKEYTGEESQLFRPCGGSWQRAMLIEVLRILPIVYVFLPLCSLIFWLMFLFFCSSPSLHIKIVIFRFRKILCDCYDDIDIAYMFSAIRRTGKSELLCSPMIELQNISTQCACGLSICYHCLCFIYFLARSA